VSGGEKKAHGQTCSLARQRSRARTPNLTHHHQKKKHKAAALVALALLGASSAQEAAPAPMADDGAGAGAAAGAPAAAPTLAPLTPEQEAEAAAARAYVESQGLGARLRWPASAAAALAASDGLNETYIAERTRGKWVTPPSPAEMEAEGRGPLEPAAAAAVKGIATAFGRAGRNVGFVKPGGTRLLLNGKPWQMAGTSAYYLARTDFLTEDEVVRQVSDVGEMKGDDGSGFSSPPSPSPPQQQQHTTHTTHTQRLLPTGRRPRPPGRQHPARLLRL
jgi:hypothetical protein